MLKLEHCCSCVIHQSQQICHHQQRYYMDSPHKEPSCPNVTDPSTYRKYADVYLKFKIHKRNTLIELTEPRMNESSK